MTGKGQALCDIKFLDFGMSITGPIVGKYFSDHGATVVKVESKERIDISRTYVPMAGNIPGINRCGWFDQYNTGKYSIGLNLNRPGGIELAKRLVAWADVVSNNFTAGMMEKWGLGYQDLVKIKPDIVMISMGLFGQTGPLAKQSGFGTMMQAAAGFTYPIGWPDRPPTGTSCPYTDFIGIWYAIVAILSALDYRSRTGKGQYIDLSQHEAGVTFLSPAILDCTINDRVVPSMGNRSSYAAPHGAYRCEGDDRWCVIAVSNDEEWQAFCRVLGNPEWTKDVKFSTHLGRKKNEDELDQMIEGWTSRKPAEEVMLKLQEAGVPAGVVETGEDFHKDPQLKHRNRFVRLDHPEMGVHVYEDSSWRLSKTPAEIRRSPLFAEHNEYVYKKILGLSDEELSRLLVTGVLE
jgi:crotonobetainyl-CoA:carnitine CoA-transferase CaiB-like acyl-CoA transferase